MSKLEGEREVPNKKVNQFLLLNQQLESMKQMEALLSWSYARCQQLELKKNILPKLEDLEKFESLTARFARLDDILLQKIFRLIDTIDLDHSGTVRDRINRAEKKGLIDDAMEFIDIRELRNTIAHEYQSEALSSIFLKVLQYTPVLLDIANRVRIYCQKYDSEMTTE
ncbi:hypothetical protein GZ77_02250 [Endozoicomonas montiporae]|uniref:RiboL-PSP-HEPN domain-containing protein n=2 Tax=Endozoicomonas montiporae TaxID=1027273 RepID=A0A081NAK8_9GAMM|nr:hypothetical protein [Endozoicomonas montiporae]AMO56841.1 hypothetical protein EZMO1_2791 [Endozoicomonas montiporae CL-33]KEQ15481.1 hypothetical protein GZ77_02250 [Endozoicomonas montiporae]